MNNLSPYIVDQNGNIKYKSISGKIYTVWGLGKYGFLHGIKTFKKRNQIEHYKIIF